MRALVYLLGCRVKNRFLAMVKSPGSLIGMLVMVALMGVVLFSGNQGAAETETFRDIGELYALCLLLFGVIFISVAKNGLNKGTSLFSMSDVNLVFTAPLSSRRVLLYGLVQQLGTSLVMGLFLLFQYSWMRQAYGISIPFLLALTLGYALVVFCAQLTAMLIYIVTSGNARRKAVITRGMVALCVLAAGYILLRVYQGQEDIIGAAVRAASGLPLALFPVAGWAKELVVGIDMGHWWLALGMLAALALYVALAVRVVTVSQSEYYEDVLQATERSFSAITAQKEGKTAESLPENIRVGKTGLGKGWGASAFFYKQRLESRRARRFLLDPMTLIFLAINLAYAFFMREYGLMSILIFSSYMLIFTVSSGRWVRELLLPYVYMVPDSAFRKLLYCLMETFYKLLMEAVLLGVGVGIMLNLGPVGTVCFILARLSFGVLFTAGMLLIERLFSGLTIKWLVMMIMILTMIILAAPGVVAAVLVGVRWPGLLPENVLMTLVPAVINFAVAALGVFASRNVLRVAELNNV